MSDERARPPIVVYIHETPPEPTPMQRAYEALWNQRADEHRRGAHTGFGNARRDCPLCTGAAR